MKDVIDKIENIGIGRLKDILKDILSEQEIERLHHYLVYGEDKVDSWDKYMQKMLFYRAVDMKEYSLLSEDTMCIPTTDIRCKLPKELEPYKESMYFLFIPNSKVDVRFTLPGNGIELKYCKEEFEVGKEIKIRHRNQQIVDYCRYKGEVVFILRGYGNKEINRNAISIYYPKSNRIWLTPSYEDILGWYKYLLDKCKEQEKFKGECRRIIEGEYPEDLILWYRKKSWNSPDDEKIACDKLLLYLLYNLAIAEDEGLFSREVLRIGIEGINNNKPIGRIRQEQDKYQKDVLGIKIDVLIEKMTNRYKFMRYIADSGAADEQVLLFLEQYEDQDVKNIYKKLLYTNHRTYKNDLSRCDMIYEIYYTLRLKALTEEEKCEYENILGRREKD